MNQLTQKLKNGKMQIVEVPLPCLQHGQILVKNFYSLISAGTETSTLKTARKGYIGKAKERPQQVKQVIDTLKTQGITQTYRAVMKKLDAYSPLGYSCAGEVIGMGLDVKGFCVGDVVACGGFTASHAEAVCVPENLCVKLRPDTDLKQAAYNTLGAIALQGVRQADLRLGETCAIIGMGLLGQLTALLLRASGVRTVGIDIDPVMIDIAEKHCLDLALHREKIGIKKKILRFTEDLGCDAVIITAASGSLDPINFAGAISRKRSTVVVVGAVPTGFDREPHFYKKELQVKMSCSYGPGRYDPIYEDKGIDYPPAYVRWTENRNMHAFQELIYLQKINVSYLTTQTFKLDEAPAAYDLIMAKSEPFIGILIEYDITKKLERTKIRVSPQPATRNPQPVSIGFVGAGSYAQSHLLPNIPKNKKVSLKGVMTATGTSSCSVAERYGFEFCTGNEKDILENENINTVFIATRHDSHAEFVLKALNAGKNVFVEKPLCLTAEELSQIVDLLNRQTDISNGNSTQQLDNSTNPPILMVGYNRRFSPLAQRMKEAFGTGPMSMLYRINAGYISADTWIQDTEFGGGRIIGEVCHFVDFLTFMNGSPPISVYAAAMTYPSNSNDTLNVSLRYENGSIGTISYFANGDKSMPKEKIEIFTNGCIAVLDDFKRLTIHASGKKKVKKMISQDKGQKTEVKQFIEAILNGTGEVIPFEEIYSASLVTFKIIESIRFRGCLKV
ncbi:MAG: bi-domain-containing oxidoreductase [Gammaproteobacteria bacterium]|nr:bi-domain-containing oxidoreductase [Gammaproteobacteria bacterium]